jgi:predicted dehydrogenase
MRVAIAGLGGAAARGHLPALRALEAEGRAAIVAACDPDGQRRLVARQLLPAVPLFATAEEMLAGVESDLLVVAAPPSAHAEIAAAGARRRLHVLCEKPAGTTPEQAAELAAIWRGHRGRALIAAYQYRFSRPWIQISRFLGGMAAGRRVVMSVDVERPVTDRNASSPWREDPAMGGGFADHAVHFLALARQLGPLEVLAAERRYDSLSRELASARLAAGPHLLNLTVSYRAPHRSTGLAVACGDLRLRWKDGALTLRRGERWVRASVAPALSDRTYVDSLYRPMYRNLLAEVERPEWRRERAEELLTVSGALTSLLAEAGPVAAAEAQVEPQLQLVA